MAIISVPAVAQTVIAHSSVPLDHMSKQQLRAVFALSKQYWPNSDSIKVAVRKAGDEFHIQFSRQVLGVFPYQLKRNWDRLSFSGMAIPPHYVSNDQEMIDYVRKNPGAIGYLDKPVELSESMGVKVVEIH